MNARVFFLGKPTAHLLLAALLWLPHASLPAALPPAAPAPHGLPTAVLPPGPGDAQEMETFLDPVMTEEMARWHVAGTVFLLVKDGSVLFSKGYGYADLERRIPVSPDQTVFRVFSLSKLFTATAIMQLVEQGKVKLDVDVNSYLKVLQIPNAYSRPVTLQDLLTHTAGFDGDQLEIGARARTEEEWLPLAPYLAKRSPSRLSPLWPPGERFLYTNLAYGVLGLVIEDVAERPFTEYMAANVLQPLGMGRSSFVQPSPFSADVALTYRYAGGRQIMMPYGVGENEPAGGLTATATDMAHFLIAHLQEGRYGRTRILQASTAQEMHRRHFTYDPEEPGQTYGFREALSPRTANGVREPAGAWGPVLWHTGGGARSPSSYVQLQPRQGLGLFLSYTSDESGFGDEVLAKFNDHYYPLGNAPARRQPVPAPNLDRFAGVYRSTGYSYRTIAKLLLLQRDDLAQVIVAGEKLAIRWGPNAPAQPDPLVQVAPLAFASADDHFRFTFLQGQGGEITGMDWGNLYVLEKVPWYETVGFQRVLWAVFVLVFVWGAVAWPLAWLVGRLRKRRAAVVTGPRRRWSSMARFLLGLTGLLNAGFLLTVVVLLGQAFDLGLEFGMPPLLATLFVVPVVTSGLAGGLLVLALPVWRSSHWSIPGRAGYTLFTLLALAFIPFLLYWNLLGFNW